MAGNEKTRVHVKAQRGFVGTFDMLLGILRNVAQQIFSFHLFFPGRFLFLLDYTLAIGNLINVLTNQIINLAKRGAAK